MRSLLGRFHRPFARGVDEQLLLLNNLGDGSTLSLDFTTGVLDPRLTFTRASGGTYVGNDGFVYGVDFATSSSLAIGTGSKSVTLTATAGASRRYEIGQTVYIANGANNMSGAVTAYNASTQVLTINATSTSGSGSFTSWIVGNASARFDYDPSTLQPRGLLIEGSASNLARYSETLETTGGFWGYNAATRTVESSDVNPTGGTGSISFAPTTNGGSRYCGLFLTGQTTTTAYTYSVWLKGKGTNICVISIQNSAGAQNATMTILSQPSGGTASVTSTGGGFSVVSNLSTTGWTKVQVVLAATLGGTGTLNVFMYPKDTSVQTTADSLFAWGAQLETGSGASSYIPSGASQGSRAQDQMQLASLSSLNFSQTVGTFVIDGHWYKDATSAAYPRSIRFQGSFQSMAVITNGKTLFGNSTNSTGGAYFEASRVLSGNNIPFKFAFSLSAVPTPTNAIAHVGLNGSVTTITPAVASPALIALPTSLDFMYSAADPTFYPAFTMKSFKYWPQYKTAAELTAMTT
jgi:hypothetical protein